MRGPVGPAFPSLGLTALKQSQCQGNGKKWQVPVNALVAPASRTGLVF